MKIYRAVRTNNLTQPFGYNFACAKVDAQGRAYRPFQIKTGTADTCPTGYAKFYPLIELRAHNGDDWKLYRGEPIYFNVEAPTTWYSREASDTDGGLGIDVFSKDPIYFEQLPIQAGPQARAYWQNHNKMIRVKFRYWHLKQTWKDVDVHFGELIGYGNSTGASSGDHAHTAMKFVDENDETFDKNNGYAGAVDSSVHFENEFVLDKLKVREQQKTVIQQLQVLIMLLTLYLRQRS